MVWSDELLATAYHEAGHAAFTLRHGRAIDTVEVFTAVEGEGDFNSPDWLARVEKLGRYNFRQGGKLWDDWKRGAVLEAAELLAGPYAELACQKKPLPDSLYDGTIPKTFRTDLKDAESVFKCWLLAVGQSAENEFLKGQVRRVEAYVKQSLSEPGVLESVQEIARLLIDNDGEVWGETVQRVDVPRGDVPAELTEWP